MRQVCYGTALVLAGAVSLSGCGGGGGGAPASPTAPSAGGATVTTIIVGSVGPASYSPNPVTARAGDTVMFRNADVQRHHIVLDNGSVDFGDLAPGATSRGLAILNGSELRFHCRLHISMVGTINGATVPEPPCVDQYGYAC